MALRDIKHYKYDEILRKKSRPVEKIDEKIKTLIKDMVETMRDAEGVGLAAPQVGILKRLVIVDIGQGLEVLINPTFVSESGENIDYEGCLSVPGMRGKVKRPDKVVVEALDENGNLRQIEAQGYMARALCHEIDHLDGILYIDKVIEGTLEEFN